MEKSQTNRVADEYHVRDYARLPVNFTPAQVALHLNVTRRTVYKWFAAGLLKPVRTGVKLLQVPLPELQRFITASNNPAPARKEPPTGAAKVATAEASGAAPVEADYIKPAPLVGYPKQKPKGRCR